MPPYMSSAFFLSSALTSRFWSERLICVSGMPSSILVSCKMLMKSSRFAFIFTSGACALNELGSLVKLVMMLLIVWKWVKSILMLNANSGFPFLSL